MLKCPLFYIDFLTLPSASRTNFPLFTKFHNSFHGLATVFITFPDISYFIARIFYFSTHTFAPFRDRSGWTSEFVTRPHHRSSQTEQTEFPRKKQKLNVRNLISANQGHPMVSTKQESVVKSTPKQKTLLPH